MNLRIPKVRAWHERFIMNSDDGSKSATVNAVVMQLVDAVNRLAVAVERLEPDKQRQVRVNAEAKKQSEENLKKRLQRRKWAKENGLKDVRAINAWANSGLAIENTTTEALKGVRQCGEKTTKILVDWAKRITR